MASDIPLDHAKLVDSQAVTQVMEAKKTPVDLRDPTVVVSASKEESDQTIELSNDYQRYEDIQPLGEGGIGVVHSCLDPHLGREVAIKALKPRYQRSKEQRTRFVREARVMSQLEHPNIVPVHEMGTRPDHSIYFSMKRIEGVALKEIIDGLIMQDPEITDKYPRSELLDLFIHVCQAVAFAHSRGVIHRDLKPENILVGSFGEILVLDWGLAKIIGEDDDVVLQTSHDIDEVLDLEKGSTTLDGSIAGTPLYMAPEQAEGKNSELSERTDLYSLGVILYEILTLERPVEGRTIREIINNITAGNIIPPRKLTSCWICVPQELNAICMKALATKPSDRYRSVRELVDDLERYRAEKQVSVYRDSLPRRVWKWCKRHSVLSSSLAASFAAIVLVVTGIVFAQRTRQNSFLTAGQLELTRAKTSSELLMKKLVELKLLKSKRIMKEAPEPELALQREVEALELKMQNRLNFALYLLNQAGVNRHPEAKECLIEIHGMRADYAVAKGDMARLNELLAFFRKRLGKNFAKAPPEIKQRLESLNSIARGNGSLTVTTDVPALHVGLWEYRDDGEGRLRPIFVRNLGRSPVPEFTLPMGSYLLVVPTRTNVPLPNENKPLPRSSADFAYYPIKVDRGEKEVASLVLPSRTVKGCVYVPAGKFYYGGTYSRSYRLHLRDLPGFLIKDREVTFGEYLTFWLDPAGGRKDPKLMSRVRISRDDYRYLDAWDEVGRLTYICKAENPVVGITQKAAEAYCEWKTVKTGMRHRLPRAEEWEKAARGVDGRDYVWGNGYRPEYAFTVENTASHKIYKHWAPPGRHEDDLSVYGAYDLGGNVREWTSSTFPNSPYYQIKGASASLTKRFLNCAYASDTPVVPSDVGFRYVIQLDQE